jgi:hypothetical protein
MVHPSFLEINTMKIVAFELLLIIAVMIIATIATIKEDKIIEVKLDSIEKKLNILINFFTTSMNAMICKKDKSDKAFNDNKDKLDTTKWKNEADKWRKP